MIAALDVLAVNNFGDTRSGGLVGPLGLLIVVLLGIATVLLIRNMSARLRRLPDTFPDQDETGPVDREKVRPEQPGEPPVSRYRPGH